MLELEPKGYILRVNEQGFFDNLFTWDIVSSQSQVILKQVVDMLLEEHKDNIMLLFTSSLGESFQWPKVQVVALSPIRVDAPVKIRGERAEPMVPEASKPQR